MKLTFSVSFCLDDGDEDVQLMVLQLRIILPRIQPSLHLHSHTSSSLMFLTSLPGSSFLGFQHYLNFPDDS